MNHQPLTAAIEIKHSYGNVLFVPVNDVAKTFATIAGTKTLTTATLTEMESLGVQFELAPMLGGIAGALVSLRNLFEYLNAARPNFKPYWRGERNDNG